VKEIQMLYPQIYRFSTLSPIPGFNSWLKTQIQYQQSLNSKSSSGLLLDEEERRLLSITKSSSGSSALEILSNILKENSWIEDKETRDVLEPILIRLCSRYILLERKRNYAFDPVTNFHIRNGACVYQLNWMSDMSAKGLERSFGIMVNYVYALDLIESNNQKYLLDGSVPVLYPVSESLSWAVNQGSINTRVRIERENASRNFNKL
jgi:malonyl-CoA decarboxylase